jgi:tape measure domain-containing protein
MTFVKELPPLRVKLIGDDSSYRLMMAGVLKDAVELERRVAKAKASASGVRGESPATAKRRDEIHQLRMANIQQSQADKSAIAQARLANVQAVQTRANAAQQQSMSIQRQLAAQLFRNRQTAANSADLAAQLRIDAVRQRSQQAAAAAAQRLNAANQRARQQAAAFQQRLHQNATAHRARMMAAQLRMQQQALAAAARLQAINDANNRANLAAAQRMQQQQQAHVQRLSIQWARAQQQLAAGQQRMQQQAAESQRRLFDAQVRNRRANAQAAQRLADMQMNAQMRLEAHQQRMRIQQEIHARRLASTYYITHPPRAQNAGTGTRGGWGGGNGGGLGDRADIYMGINSMRTMAQAVSAPLKASAEWQQMTIMFEGFLGSAKEAKNMMEDLQKQALTSPYTSQDLATNAKLLIGYGMAAEQAKEVLQQLGDVAVGDSNKMDKLALAMAQINSLGKLQGQELRQLTEHGFNPLATIAKATGKPLAEMMDLMKKGAVSSAAVSAALKIETSEGGRFAGMAARMNDSLIGLTNQIKEYGMLIGRKLMDTMLGEIEQFLRQGVRIIKQYNAWIDNNKELAKQYAQLAAKVFIAVFTIKAFALAIAIVRWNLTQLRAVMILFWTLLYPVRLGIMGITVALGALRGTLTLLRLGFLATWAAALGPIAAIIAALPVLGASIVGISWLVTHPGGLKGAFDDASWAINKLIDGGKAFFYNWKENMPKLVTYVRDNWATLLADMLTLVTKFADIAGNMMLNALTGTTASARLAASPSHMAKRFKADALTTLYGTIGPPGDIYPEAMADLAKLKAEIGDAEMQAAKADLTPYTAKADMANFLSTWKPSSPALPEFNWSMPSTPEPEKPELPALPTPGDFDWGSMLNAKGKGDKAPKDFGVSVEGSASGSDFYKRHYNASMGLTPTVASANTMEEKQDKTNALLKQIVTNTKPTAQGATVPANIGVGI